MRWCLLIGLLLAGCAAVEATPKAPPELPREVVDSIMRQADNQAAILTRLDSIQQQTSSIPAIQAAIEEQAKKYDADPVKAEEPVKAADPPKIPLFVSSIESCAPCVKLKADVDSGAFSDFDVQYVSDPGVDYYPRIRYEDPDRPGKFAFLTGYDSRTLPFLKSRLLQKADNAVSEGAKANPGATGGGTVVRSVQRKTSRGRGFLGLFRSSNCSTGTCR